MRSLTTWRPGIERRAHDFGDVLGPIGGDDQRLGSGVELGHRDVVENRPQALTDRRPARLARQHRADRVGQPLGLGALAATLWPFEGDVDRRRHRMVTLGRPAPGRSAATTVPSSGSRRWRRRWRRRRWRVRSCGVARGRIRVGTTGSGTTGRAPPGPAPPGRAPPVRHRLGQPARRHGRNVRRRRESMSSGSTSRGWMRRGSTSGGSGW